MIVVADKVPNPHIPCCLNTFFLIPLIIQIVNVFNMFINYGDQFMPSLADYDELYYELLCSEKELRTFLEVGMFHINSL